MSSCALPTRKRLALSPVITKKAQTLYGLESTYGSHVNCLIRDVFTRCQLL